MNHKMEQFAILNCELHIHKVQQCYIYLCNSFWSNVKLPDFEDGVIRYLIVFFESELLEDINERFSAEGWRHLLTYGWTAVEMSLSMDMFLLAYKKYVLLYPEDKEIREACIEFLGAYGPVVNDDARELRAYLGIEL